MLHLLLSCRKSVSLLDLENVALTWREMAFEPFMPLLHCVYYFIP